MLVRPRFLLLLPVVALIACGGGTPPPTGVSYTPASGDYVITTGVGTAGAGTFSGNLLVNQPTLCNGANVCGVFHYNSPSVCVSSGVNIPFSGSYQSNVLTLTSAAFSSNVATFSIKLPFANNNINQQLASGTGAITGGACALSSSALQAQLIPSVSGTWNIALTAPSSASATLTITETTTPNTDGSFPVSGSIACSGATGPPPALTGSVDGTALQLWLASAPPPSGNPVVIANYTPIPATVVACGGTGTMTAQ